MMTDILIDPETWEMMKSMTDPAFLVELIDTYISDTPNLIEQMQRGLATGDIELTRRAAHSLKSNSASFGANRLAESSRSLEMLAKGGTLDGAAPLLTAIEAEYSLLLPRLVELKNEQS
jgi:two-component system, sensor histidine kinase and response regulator